jgi:hypothetical protein
MREPDRGLSFKRQFERLEMRALLSVGGGFTAGGLTGNYFADTTLTGTPAFSRQDVRVDFDWTNAEVGGSTSPAYQSFPNSGFSVQWTGQLVPKFSETYTFDLASQGGVQLYFKLPSATTWTTLTNDWTPHALTVDTASVPLVAGTTYDVELNYADTAGPGVVKLHWSSPSTPDEAIDPLGGAAVTAETYDNSTYADAMKMGRTTWENNIPTDASGWPLTDGTNVVWEGQSAASVAGTYALQFQGEAEVEPNVFGPVTFVAGGQTYTGALPAGAGYNAASNTTTATMSLTAANAGILYLTFVNSQRSAALPVDTGVTDISLMRPTSPGASTSYAPGTLFATDIEAAYAPFTTERWLTANFNTTEVNWSDRTLPSYAEANFADRGQVWEYLVMLANETGKDLYITIPVNASQQYVTDLANLIKYGSDGVNAYTSPQANPVYPGLNPNLRLYLEWSNETWGGFSQAAAVQADSAAAVAANTPEGQIINFDGQAPNGSGARWTALKIEETSQIFRSVWGDAAMGATVRPVYEYQYDNDNDTASSALSFLDDYFNNADGIAHVAAPHPVSYFLWGGGAATYYAATNPNGDQSAITVPNASFETPKVSAGGSSTRPSGASWTFTGSAGIFANASTAPAEKSQTLGTAGNTLTSEQALGYEFTVGSSAVEVYELGRWVTAGNSGIHTVQILDLNQNEVAQVNVSTAGATPGQYLYASLARPVVLQANTTYYLVSNEFAGGDTYYGSNTTISASSSIKIDNAVSAAVGTPGSASTSWTLTDGPTGKHTFGPVDLLFATRAVGSLGYPPNAPDGTQAAFIGGTGTMSAAINFTAAGTFAFELDAANKVGFENGVRLYIVDSSNHSTEITPNGSSYTALNAPWTPGQGVYGYDEDDYNLWDTAPFSIASPGVYTLKIVGTGSSSNYTFIDDLTITSADAIFNSAIPSIGEALGQPQTTGISYQNELDAQADYAEAYGLQVVAYEGGWSLGGDGGGTPLENWAKYVDPQAAQANIASLDAFTASGGVLDTFGTYSQWTTAAGSANQPLMQGIIARDATLPAPATNGILLPAFLSRANLTLAAGQANSSTLGLSAGGDFVDWNILVPQYGTYNLILTTVGSGGTANLLVDDRISVASGATGGALSGSVMLAPGLHSVQVQAGSSVAFSVSQVAIAQSGAPPAPVLTSGTVASGSIALTWQSVAGTTGYEVAYGNASGLYSVYLGVGDTTTATITGLDNSKVYYVVVLACAPGGQYSLPSNELRLAHPSTNPPVLVDFESLAVSNAVLPEPLSLDGFSFSSVGVDAGHALMVEGSGNNTSPGNWPSNVLFAAAWGAGQNVTQTGGGTFDLDALDLDANNQAQSAIVTAYDASGTELQQVVNLPASSGQNVSITVALGWLAIDRFTVTWWQLPNGGGAARFGAIDNLLIDQVAGNQPPTIAVAGSASPAQVSGVTANLSVLGADDGGQSNLSYDWSAIALPPGANSPTFSATGTNTAQNTTVTFSQAGNYTFQALVKDQGGLSVASDISVTVSQTLTGILISPATATVSGGGSFQFTAVGSDQFGAAMTTPPAAAWSVSSGGAGGSISSSGRYTAPTKTAGTDTVTATSGGFTATASVTIPTAATNIFNTTVDVGSPSKSGSATFSAGTYTVQGAGTSIGGTSDQFRFDYLNLAGNGTLVAQVLSVQNTNSAAEAGIMFRDGTAAGAEFIAVLINPAGSVSLESRTTTGGSASTTTVSGRTIPQYVELVRSGSSFTGYYSSDGSTWLKIGSAKTISIATTAAVGLAVTSHNSSKLCMATFANASVVPSAGVAQARPAAIVSTANAVSPSVAVATGAPTHTEAAGPLQLQAVSAVMAEWGLVGPVKPRTSAAASQAATRPAIMGPQAPADRLQTNGRSATPPETLR